MEQTGMIQGQVAQSDQMINPDDVTKQMKLPPELQRAYDRFVLAGMKLMFSEQTHKLMLDALNKPGPIAQRLGDGIAALVLTMFKESNGNIPPQVLIPAGTDLLMQAADFVKKSGIEPITNQDIGDATEEMIGVILDKFGVSKDKLAQLTGNYSQEATSQGGKGPGSAETQAAAQAAPAQPQQQPQPGAPQ